LIAILADGAKRRSKPVWHLGSADELENRRIAGEICALCGADPDLITLVPDRTGHDQRYALDYSQTARVLGWEPTVPFVDGLRATMEWIKNNQDWCRRRTGWTPAFLREP
jgi:dTDP-glucose 4,6-dehydratase